MTDGIEDEDEEDRQEVESRRRRKEGVYESINGDREKVEKENFS